MAKVVHLTSAHPADDVRIYHKECTTLARAGYEVVLIAPAPKHPLSDEKRSTVRVVTIAQSDSGRLGRMTGTTQRVYHSAIAEDADIYHFHDPELIGVGLLLKARGKKVIYDVHEDLPRQILTKHWISPLVRRSAAVAAEIAEAAGSFVFDAIVAATPKIGARFPTHKTIVINNYPLENELSSPGATPYTSRPNIIAYVGGLTAIRGAREMIEAMDLLPPSLEATLQIAGTFSPDSLQDELRTLPGWTRVDYLGWLPRSDVAALLSRSRAGIVVFHPVPNHTEAQPNKLFEYMSAGLPVIASDFSLWREIVERNGAGIMVNPMDPTAIAGAIERLLQGSGNARESGERGAAAVREWYSWVREGERLTDLYRCLI